MITPDLAMRIEALRAPGLPAKALQRRLAEAGIEISWGTLVRWLAKQDAASPVAPGVVLPGSPGVAAAVESDDLERLRAVRREIEDAMRGWSKTLNCDRAAVLSYTALTRSLGELTARIVELTPRGADAEDSRLSALGLEARNKLVARMREKALEDEGLRARLNRQQAVIDRLIDEKAE